MKHLRVKRLAATLCATALGVGALVAVNLGASSASPQTAGGERVASWTGTADSDAITERADLVAPSGQTFVTAVPHDGSVIAIRSDGTAVG